MLYIYLWDVVSPFDFARTLLYTRKTGSLLSSCANPCFLLFAFRHFTYPLRWLRYFSLFIYLRSSYYLCSFSVFISTFIQYKYSIVIFNTRIFEHIHTSSFVEFKLLFLPMFMAAFTHVRRKSSQRRATIQTPTNHFRFK